MRSFTRDRVDPSRSVRLGGRDVRRLFAALQPDVVDGVLYGVEARAFGEHPPSEDAPDFSVEGDLVYLDEGIRLGLFGGRARVADARRHLESTELHGFIDIDVEGDDTAGDLVDASKLGNGVADAFS